VHSSVTHDRPHEQQSLRAENVYILGITTTRFGKHADKDVVDCGAVDFFDLGDRDREHWEICHHLRLRLPHPRVVRTLTRRG